MDNSERVIGQLQEFRTATLDKLSKLEEKVDKLNEFKWRAAGAMGLLVAMSETAHLILKMKGIV